MMIFLGIKTMTAAVFMVFITLLVGILYFRRIRKMIERKLDLQYLEEIRKEEPIFNEYLKEDEKGTAKKLKQLEKMKGQYND